MSLTKNDALRNAQADALGARFNSGTLQIRTGTRPADPDSAATGTLLVTISIPASPFNAASSGAITKTGVWTGTAVANGTATWGRFISSDTLETMDGDVAAAAADIIISDVNIVIAQEVTVSTGTITIPDGV